MNGIDIITEKIVSEARSAVEEKIKAAEEYSSGVIAEAKSNAEDKASAILGKAAKNCEDIARRTESVTDLDKRKMLLSAKREVLDEIFAGLEKEIFGLEESEYAAFLRKLIKNAPKSEEILFSEKDYEIGKGVIDVLSSEGFRFANVGTTDKIDSGFILVDGAVKQVYSLKEIIMQYRAQAEPKVVSLLFSDEVK